MKLKVCGMKYVENIQQVGALQPDYLGFIFYEKSKRNFEGIIPDLPSAIKKTGVFVNEILAIVISPVFASVKCTHCTGVMITILFFRLPMNKLDP